MSSRHNSEKTFFSNLVFLFVINLIIKPFYVFGIDLAIQNRVGPDVFGRYIAILGFVYLFQIIGDAGMRSYNNGLIAKDKRNILHTLKPSLYLKLMLSFLFVIITLVFSKIMGYQWAGTLLLWVVISQALNGVLLFIRSTISGLSLYRWDSILSILDKLFMILICGSLLYLPYFKATFQIEWFVYAQLFSFLLTLIIALIILYIHRPNETLVPFEKKQIWVFLKKSLPYAGIIFLMTIYTRIDIVMLDKMLPNEGEYQVGLYQGGLRFVELLHIVGLLFAGLLLPMYAAQLKDKNALQKLVSLGFSLLFTMAIPIAIVSYFYSQEIMDMFYKASTPEWGHTFRFTILSFIGIAGMYIFSTLLTAAGATKILTRIFLIGCLLNIVGNYILIPTYKAEGAAMMTLITQSYIMLANIYYVQKLYLTTSFVKQYKKVLFFALIVIGVSYYVHSVVADYFIFLYIGLGVFSLLLSFLMKIIDVKKIRSFLSA